MKYKFMCLDFDNCGYIEIISNPQENSYCEANTCPDCMGVAVVLNKNYEPIFNKTEEDIDQLIATIANMLNKPNRE